MSVLKKEELMEKLKAIIGEKTDDETLSFIEDVNDTFDDKSGTQDGEDWQKKYEDNDKMWREKYRDRFFNKDSSDDDDDDDIIENKKVEDKPLTFENLFETKEE